MAKGEPLPENVRCNRTDGRQWRCNRPVIENKKLCQIHYLQGRHRQHKEKVPDSLKLERKPRKNQGIGGKKKVKNKKRSGGEIFEESLKESKLKRGDFELELIREMLIKKVEKKKEREIEEFERQKSNLMKDLANGVMSITPSEISSNAGVYNVKLGPSSCLFEQSRFRSKNIEPLLTKLLPGLREAIKLRRGKKKKKCHWCRRSRCNDALVKCTSCDKHFFCKDCTEERGFDKQNADTSCPVCLGTCRCMACLTNQSKEVQEKDHCKENENDNFKLLHYLIQMLLPVLQIVNLDQSTELDIESRIKGKTHYELHIPQIKLDCEKFTSCNNCRASIVDLHRSCTRCSYNLCLSCCREFRREQSSGGINHENLTYLSRRGDGSSDELPSKRKRNTSTEGFCKKSIASPKLPLNLNVCEDEIISCTPNSFGGCGENTLDLRSVFSFGWIKELQASVEELLDSYDFPETPDVGTHCSLCRKTDHRSNRIMLLQETARRNYPSDNLLYYPTVQDLHIENLEHFQKHWAQGHPIILNNLTESTSNLNWDPFIMFYTYLGQQNSGCQNDAGALKSKNCLDWCEVEICDKKSFMGSLSGRRDANDCHETVKLQCWLSSHLFQEHFPSHYARIMNNLPLKEYINPKGGILNLAGKLPNEMQKPDLGPRIYIAYGGQEELTQANYLTRLRYDSYDVVNILAQATDIPISTEELSRLKALFKKHEEQDHSRSAGNATGQPLENQYEATSMLHREYAEEVPRKVSLCSEDTEESVSQDVTGGGLNLPDGIPRDFMHSSDSQRGCARTPIDLNISNVSEQDHEYDSEATVSVTIQGYEVSEDEIESSSYDERNCGAQWDIFRRQDVPKLLEYLRRYSKELSQAYCSPKHVHPILDQSFFLDAFHIMRLKEESDIEPWTFKQNIGEAVMIPAGCPYQVKKLKSCVNVILEFISPESAHECIRLADELRLLPQDHKAKRNIPEVENMTIYGVNAAVKEIINLTLMDSAKSTTRSN